jgi:hypothetical protein
MQEAKIDKGPIDISFKLPPMSPIDQKIWDLNNKAAKQNDIAKRQKIRQQVEKLKKDQIKR